MSKPIIADMPYPTTDDLTCDLCAAKQLSRAYSTSESEFTAVSQYMFQHFNFYSLCMPEYADEMEGIAIAEMRHLELLGRALIKMGVSPVFAANPPKLCNFFSTSSAQYNVSPQRMIMDDIAAEMAAIELYKDILAHLNNEQAGAIVQRIILDEELHLAKFNEMLQRLVKA